MVQINLDPQIKTADLSGLLEKEYSIQNNKNSPWTLTKSSDGNFLLIDTEKRKLTIDFDLNKQDYKRPHRGSGELIARALGAKENIKNILDLTAGLGIDAVFLSQLGFNVVSIERNPILVFLLHQAQLKSKQPEIKNIKWILSDSQEFLKKYEVPNSTSCYFDPMFPEKKKSALPRQEMVIFRELIGEDQDAAETLRQAVSKKFSRIVVKRPLKSEVLLERPDFQLTSKLLRYDVYYQRNSK